MEEFLRALDALVPEKTYGGDFAARVYKIARDAQGKRLSYMKITGGELKVRDLIRYRDEKGNLLEEKVSQIRLYSGMKYEAAERALPGQVCAVLGLSACWPGQGLGAEADAAAAVLEPVLSYRVILPKGCDPALMLPKMQQLGQEDPQLHIRWNERLSEISVQLMGKVQTEVLKSLVKERFDVDIQLDTGRILYKETIGNVVIPASIPVIAGEEGICAGCGVATLTISYYDIGYKTGEMAVEILVNGADISTMPIEYAPQFVKKYNPEIAESLGVAIPEGYEAM